MHLLKAAGGRCSRKAQDVQVIDFGEDLAEYMAKGSAAWEVSNAGATKESKGGLTPWDLAVTAANGNHQAARLFREYAAVMPGTRSCVVSPKIARELGLAETDDADQEAIEEEKAEEELVTDVGRADWHRILRNGHVPTVLSAIWDGAGKARIDELIDQLLGNPKRPPPLPVDDGRPILERVHAPSVSELVKEIQSTWGLKTKDAIETVIGNHRSTAKATRQRLVMPDMTEVVRRL
ncbi:MULTISPECIES: hypothetical protein [unclassified Roseibium]|uniref:hypothetical protein n=1 Tax=unclassified Roseibium TaxID=2629323 RepID=UPI00273D0058|nr:MULTISPECIES: hypothetical protein [unclassified Roseibium]